jgi:hypothetical protein
LDNERSALIGRRVTEQGLAGAYNFAVFLTTKRTGARTSLIVDPPDGRIPPRTPQAQKAAAADREFHLALLQSTETCKKKDATLDNAHVVEDYLATTPPCTGSSQLVGLVLYPD